VENEVPTTTGAGQEPDAVVDAGLPSWGSAFPSGELDELRGLLKDGPPRTPDAMADLLDAVGAKAIRLRSTMLRMVADRLTAAEEEAASIRRAAFEEATRTRQEAVRVMAERLEEAEGAAAAIRQAALAEERRAKRKALPLLTSAAAQVEALRDEISRLFDAAGGLVPSLSEAAEQVRQLIAELEAPPQGTPDGAESDNGAGAPDAAGASTPDSALQPAADEFP
jgi:hypothetical protein